MEILNLTPEKGKLEGQVYNLGNIPYSLETSFKIQINGVKHKNTIRGCGTCTKVAIKELENGVELTIKYTPFKGGAKGDFSKSITEQHSFGETKIIFKGTAK